MTTKKINLNQLPDIASTELSSIKKTIDFVGMSNIDCFILWPQNNQHLKLQAQCNINVNLINPLAKGIHMSRLYQLLTKHVATYPITPVNIDILLQEAIDSHNNLSNSACLSLAFSIPVNQSSLQSSLEGKRFYPVTITATKEKNKATIYKLDYTITYSSTCPCSAALSRKAIAEQFDTDFCYETNINKETIIKWLESNKGTLATPHSQRSKATLTVTTSNIDHFPLEQYITDAETYLQTAVQTIVKREDEQAFAKQNGEHLMFAEDAVRKLALLTDNYQELSHYKIVVTHFESLHPHNATASIEKKQLIN